MVVYTILTAGSAAAAQLARGDGVTAAWIHLLLTARNCGIGGIGHAGEEQCKQGGQPICCGRAVVSTGDANTPIQRQW